MRTNEMKASLAAGQPVYGCSIMIPSIQTVEMLGHAGFDWVLIDMEHGTIGLETAELMVMAAEAVGLTPIVRPASKASSDISAAMDRGAAGVQIPHINTAVDAARGVAAVKFGGGDQRGLAAGTRPDSYGMAESMSDFVDHSNEQSLVCVQIEHRSAVENIDELLAVDEIDVFFIGPSDLSQSMGYPGAPDAEPVKAAIATTLERIVAAGKTPGMPSTTANVQTLMDAGILYTYTHLPKLLKAGCDGYLSARRK